jgi:hypothetical protein
VSWPCCSQLLLLAPLLCRGIMRMLLSFWLLLLLLLLLLLGRVWVLAVPLRHQILDDLHHKQADHRSQSTHRWDTE